MIRNTVTFSDISELPDYRLKSLRRFFEDYKALELKQVTVERVMGRTDALKVIVKAIELYKEHVAELTAGRA